MWRWTILSILLCGCGSGVRSLRLTDHVPSRVRAACAQAARATRVRVVCPPLVPGSGVTSERDLYGPQVLARDVYTLSFNNGQVPGHIHWEVGAGTLAGVAAAEFDERGWDAPAPKQPVRLIGGDRCGGYLIRIYRFPVNDGQLAGHDVALASAGRITYFASVHGYADDAADVAMLLAILRSARGDHVTRVGAALAGLPRCSRQIARRAPRWRRGRPAVVARSTNASPSGVFRISPSRIGPRVWAARSPMFS